jgi:hypothetical protein
MHDLSLISITKITRTVATASQKHQRQDFPGSEAIGGHTWLLSSKQRRQEARADWDDILLL